MAPPVDPRIERTRTVVLQTAVEIVAEQGFAGASIDAIAQRSGVARSTIYRHWPQKMDLLLEAVGSAAGDIGSLTVGDLREDLIAVSTHLAELLGSEPRGSVMASIILESRREPALDELRRKLIAQRQLAVERVIGDAMSRGDLRDTERADVIANDLAAQIMFRSLVLRESMDRAWIEDLVDRVLRLHRDRP
ncbi:MAG: TetR/AcrR family transcriptional regulator [Acidimicrobiia bacterium]